MKWGDKIDFYHSLVDKGIIKEEDKEPILGPYESLIEAFYELSTERHVGMALGAIPILSIVEYYNNFAIVESLEDFVYYIRVLDIVFMERENGGKSKNGKRSSKS